MILSIFQIILASHTVNAHSRNFKSRNKIQGGTSTNAKSELTKCFFCQKILSTSEEYFRHATKAHQVIVSVCFYVCLSMCKSVLFELPPTTSLNSPNVSSAKNPFDIRRVFQTRYQSSSGYLLLSVCFYVCLSICESV
jgi:hypothetical protein